jgi:nicotinamidase-related amidase
MLMSSREMLSSQNCAIALIDIQSAMYQSMQSHDRLVTFNNVQVLAKAPKLFGIPTVLSTVEAMAFARLFMPEILHSGLITTLDSADRTASTVAISAGSSTLGKSPGPLFGNASA